MDQQTELQIKKWLSELEQTVKEIKQFLAPVIIVPQMVRPNYELYGWGITQAAHNMPLENVTKFIIHHDGATANGVPVDKDADALAIHRWHREANGWAAIGYHAWIRKDGTIQEGRPLWAMGAHAGSPTNSTSWAVALAGNFNLVTPTDAQYASLNLLLNYWWSLRPQATVHPHKAVKNTDCPGNLFDMTRIQRRV